MLNNLPVDALESEAGPVLDAMRAIGDEADLGAYELRAIMLFKQNRAPAFVEKAEEDDAAGWTGCWSEIWPVRRATFSANQRTVFEAILTQTAQKLMAAARFADAWALFVDATALREDAGTEPEVAVLYNEALCIKMLVGGGGGNGREDQGGVDAEAAMGLFRKCLEMDPAMGKAAFSLSHMLMSGQGDPKPGALNEAVEVLAKATCVEGDGADGAAGPGPLAADREAHFNLAVACMRLLTESVAAAGAGKGDDDDGGGGTDAVDVAEADVEAAGKWAGLAKRSFYKVLELPPVDASRKVSGESADWLVHKVLGSIALNENDFEKAIHHLKLACAAESSPLNDHFEVQYNMGFSYLQMDSLEMAFQHFKRAHRIDPDREMARDAIAMLRDSAGGEGGGGAGGGGGGGGDIAAAAAAATAAFEAEEQAKAEATPAAAVAAADAATDLEPLKPEQLSLMKQKSSKRKKSKRISTKKSSVDLSSEEVEQLKLKLKPSRGGPRHGRHRSSQEVIPWGNTSSLAQIWLRNAKSGSKAKK
jgi:tetratricopeptide (TPR) repeat protein